LLRRRHGEEAFPLRRRKRAEGRFLEMMEEKEDSGLMRKRRRGRSRAK
jgi:hypothetical protein